MAENFISSIKVGAVSYNIKDTEARTKLAALEALVESGVQIVIVDSLPTASVTSADFVEVNSILYKKQSTGSSSYAYTPVNTQVVRLL